MTSERPPFHWEITATTPVSFPWGWVTSYRDGSAELSRLLVSECGPADEGVVLPGPQPGH